MRRKRERGVAVKVISIIQIHNKKRDRIVIYATCELISVN